MTLSPSVVQKACTLFLVAELPRHNLVMGQHTTLFGQNFTSDERASESHAKGAEGIRIGGWWRRAGAYPVRNRDERICYLCIYGPVLGLSLALALPRRTGLHWISALRDYDVSGLECFLRGLGILALYPDCSHRTIRTCWSPIRHAGLETSSREAQNDCDICIRILRDAEVKRGWS